MRLHAAFGAPHGSGRFRNVEFFPVTQQERLALTGGKPRQRLLDDPQRLALLGRVGRVYGERPFSGGTLQELSESVCGGRVRPEPQEASVPGWVREIVVRGLSRSPADRWPSMNALLAEMEKQPAMASRRRFARAASAKLAGIWEAPRGQTPVETPAKAEMWQVFLATGKPYAAKAWQGVSAILDRYAQRWSDLYVEACEATHVRGDQSAEVLDLRMACLEEGRADLAALVRLFRYATGEVVENAVAAANALGTLERCENIELLRSVVRPPADVATRIGADRLRAQLAEVRALCRVGRIKDGLALAKPLERAARDLGYLPLLAEVLLATCRLPEEQGASFEAARLSEEALLTAIACRHEEVAAEAATLLVGHSSTRFEAAEVWSGLAEALLRRIGGHDRLWGWLYTNRSGLRTLQGRAEEALADEHRAVEAKEKALGPEDPDVGISIGNLAVCLDNLGRLSEAIEYARRGAAIVEAGLGPDHPRTGVMLTNLGEFLARAGRWGEATVYAERGLAIFERETETDGLFIFAAATALGLAHLGAGRVETALELLVRADRMGETHAPTPAFRAQTRFALARARWEAGKDRPGAEALARIARQEYAASPTTPAIRRELAAIDDWLGARAGKS